MIDTEDIKNLRAETGAGIMDIKNALEEASGDAEKAKEILRKKGAAIATKKGSRQTKEGVVVSYVHAGGRVGVLLKLYCETDFVAKTKEFQTLAGDIAMHIAAMDPQYLSRQNIPADVIEAEKSIYKEQLVNANKPDEVMEKILEVKIDKFVQENCLPEQSFVKDSDKNVRQLIEEHIAKLGENIQIGEFVRYEL